MLYVLGVIAAFLIGTFFGKVVLGKAAAGTAAAVIAVEKDVAKKL